MAISDRQKELDEIKWIRSIELGFDACGSFDYCKNCDKNAENPCDNAYQIFNKPKKTCAKKSTISTTNKKSTAKSTAKKSSTKTTAKKTTAKKTTKK